MKWAFLFSILLTLTIGFSSTLAVIKPDFSGKWVLDKSKSERVPPAISEQTMNISQKDNQIIVENRYVTTALGNPETNETYVLSGKDTEFVWKRLNGQEGLGKRRSSLSEDGRVLDVNQEALFDSPAGPVTWQSTQKWSLSDDGKLLTIDTTVKILPFTVVPLKYVFMKM